MSPTPMTPTPTGGSGTPPGKVVVIPASSTSQKGLGHGTGDDSCSDEPVRSRGVLSDNTWVRRIPFERYRLAPRRAALTGRPSCIVHRPAGRPHRHWTPADPPRRQQPTALRPVGYPRMTPC